mgnify:CR=1 FL=1
MPYMVSDKTMDVAYNGVNAQFFAGVTRFVRPSLQRVAELNGARVVQDSSDSTESVSIQSVPEQTPTDEQVYDAIQSLMQSGDIKAFDTQQAPKVRELTKLVGVRVSAAQRDRVWEQFGS